MKKKNRGWLKALRIQKGLTQQDVATKAEIERSYYTMIETGQRKPSVLVAKAIGSAMGFDWTIFFEDEGNEVKQKRAAV